MRPKFKSIVDELNTYKNKISEHDVYIPFIEKKGDEELDLMVQPIFEEIQKWMQTRGDKELVLGGISNGARIAKGVKRNLRN